MSETKRISQEELARARRQLIRRIGAVMVRCMADSDMSFADIGARIEKSEDEVRAILAAFIDGSSKATIRDVADFLVATGHELEMTLVKREPRPVQVARAALSPAQKGEA